MFIIYIEHKTKKIGMLCEMLGLLHVICGVRKRGKEKTHYNA